jgi:hypothetical protein
MNSTEFRIPDTNLFLRADGTISPTAGPGGKVQELTSKNSRLLNVVYHGQTLKHIVYIKDEKSTLGGNEDLSLSAAKDIFDWVGIGTSTLDFAEKLNRWITGANGAPDPVIESLRQIHDALSQLQDFALASWFSARQDNLAFLLAHSSTAIQTANAFLQSNASRSDPVWATKIAIAERDSLLAVNTFSDVQRGFWLRPQNIAAISWAGNPTDYYHGWMPHIPDRAEVAQFNQVWDYRWAQPALLYTIVARLIVLKAFEIGSKAERKLYCQEIDGYVKILGTVFSKRWSGIRTLELLSDLQRNEYSTTGRIPMVAADIYGGDYIGGIFFASNITTSFFAPGIAAPNIDDFRNPTRALDLVWVENNTRAFAHHWWNLLYLRTGIDELFLFISNLQVICKEPWFSRTYVDVQKTLGLAKKDEKIQKAVFVAVALSELVPAGDEAANATRAHFLYKALRTGGGHAEAIVAKCVQDLSYLNEAGEESTEKMEQAGSVTTSAAKQRKRGKANLMPRG